MNRIVVLLLIAAPCFGQLRIPSLLVTEKGADSTFVRPDSMNTGRVLARAAVLDSLRGDTLRLGRVNPLGYNLPFWDSTGNFHVGEALVVGPGGANRVKTIIDPGNEYDFEININGLSGGQYPFSIYCTEYDTLYYFVFYNQWGGSPKMFSTYPLHLYGAKEKSNLMRDTFQFAVFDSNGLKRVTIEDSVNLSPIKVYDTGGNLSSYFGAKTRVDTMGVNKEIVLYGSDTMTVSHANDTTFFSTTANTVCFSAFVCGEYIYAFGGFSDSTATVPVTKDSISSITNATNTLFNVGAAAGVTVAGDSAIILRKGLYKIEHSFSLAALNGKDFDLGMSKNSTAWIGAPEAITTTGATNFANCAGFCIGLLDSGDVVKPAVLGITDGTDPIFRSGEIYLQLKH